MNEHGIATCLGRGGGKSRSAVDIDTAELREITSAGGSSAIDDRGAALQAVSVGRWLTEIALHHLDAVRKQSRTLGPTNESAHAPAFSEEGSRAMTAHE